MGHLHKDARPIAGGFVASAGPPMAEVHQDFQTILDDGMRLAAFDVTYQADPASVVLKTRIIQSQAGLVII
jgi:hypothetical protein